MLVGPGLESHLIHHHIGRCVFPIVIPDERHSIPYIKDSIAPFTSPRGVRLAVCAPG